MTEALVSEEMNGSWDLNCTLITRPAEMRGLIPSPGRVLAACCPAQTGEAEARPQPFRIREITYQSDGLTHIRAEHIYFDALDRPAPGPFQWENADGDAVCAVLSLLSGCVRYRAGCAFTVTGSYSGSAPAIAERICREKELQLVRDGTEALLLPLGYRRRGMLLREEDTLSWTMEETLENGTLFRRAEVILPENSRSTCRVFDTVTFREIPLTVNRVLFDPLSENNRALWLGRAEPRLNGNAFSE